MSQTFTLTGVGNVLSATYFPPIDLDRNYQYGLGLVGFYGCNSIRNIFEGNNKFYYTVDGVFKEITIPSGAYEVEEINRVLQKRINEPSNSMNFTLRPNNNTLKCEIKTVYDIDFTKSDSIGRMLGFSPKLYKGGGVHESDLDVQIVNATNIDVECNLTGGAYRNSVLSHTIFEFNVHVEPGYKLVKEPATIIYLPVLAHQIDNITLRLVDQDGQLVDFGEEKVTIRLELKKYGTSNIL